MRRLRVLVPIFALFLVAMVAPPGIAGSAEARAQRAHPAAGLPAEAGALLESLSPAQRYAVSELVRVWHRSEGVIRAGAELELERALARILSPDQQRTLERLAGGGRPESVGGVGFCMARCFLMAKLSLLASLSAAVDCRDNESGLYYGWLASIQSNGCAAGDVGACYDASDWASLSADGWSQVERSEQNVCSLSRQAAQAAHLVSQLCSTITWH